MRIDYSFVEFFNPVFSQGKNHGLKIKASSDIKLFYDDSIPNAKMNMDYKGHITSFDTYHSADMMKNKPHPASKEAKLMRESNKQGE